jgi:hypothetical protein
MHDRHRDMRLDIDNMSYEVSLKDGQLVIENNEVLLVPTLSSFH